MTLTLGVFLHILHHCCSVGITQAELLSALVSTVEENESLTGDTRLVQHIFSCERGFPRTAGVQGGAPQESSGGITNIVPLMRYADLAAMAQKISAKVFPLLDQDKSRMLFLALRHVVREDASIFKGNSAKFHDWTGFAPTEFVFLQHINFGWLLAGLFKYCTLAGKYTSGKATLKTIRGGEFWNKIEAFDYYLFADDLGDNPPLEKAASLQGLDSYLHAIRREYEQVKTFFDWKRYFQFDELFVCSDIRPYAESPSGFRKPIPNATAMTLAPISQYLILYGTGGMGKSMMMRHLLFDAIDNVQERNIIPFFVTLRYYHHHGNQDLVHFILEESEDAWPGLDETLLREILASGKALILLDGLDEVKSNEADILRAKLHELIKKYPDNQYIMSSRPFDHHFRSYTQFRTAEVCGLRVEQVDDLIVRVGYMEKNLERREAFRDIIRERMRTQDRTFCENPLLLTIMMLIFSQHRSLPTKRHAFYYEAYSVLFSRHDSQKDGGFIRELRSKLTEEEFQLIFSEFCFKTYFREEYEFTKDQFIATISSLKSWQRVKERTGTDQFLLDACVNLCIMDECGTDYSFIHRSFQEYFCACWLKEKTDEMLKKKVAWFEAEKKRTMEDCVFSFLHEMAQIRVEKNMIFPVLEDCLTPRDGAGMYWSYLMNQYPSIPYVIGLHADTTFEPKSAILMYVLDRLDAFHKDLVPDSIPYESIFCDTVYFSVSPRIGHPAREEAMLKTYYKQQSRTYVTVVRRDMNILPDMLWDAKNTYPKLYNYFVSKKCPLAQEFVKLKAYYEQLRIKLQDEEEEEEESEKLISA